MVKTEEIIPLMVACVQGNPGALNTLVALRKLKDDHFFVPLLLALKMTKTKAPSIWFLRKDICNDDLEKTADFLQEWMDTSIEPLQIYLGERFKNNQWEEE